MRTKHSVRVPEDLWAMAKAKAKLEYTSVTAIVIQALMDYVKNLPQQEEYPIR